MFSSSFSPSVLPHHISIFICRFLSSFIKEFASLCLTLLHIFCPLSPFSSASLALLSITVYDCLTYTAFLSLFISQYVSFLSCFLTFIYLFYCHARFHFTSHTFSLILSCSFCLLLVLALSFINVLFLSFFLFINGFLISLLSLCALFFHTVSLPYVFFCFFH